jgi:hypothetical protein
LRGGGGTTVRVRVEGGPVIEPTIAESSGRTFRGGTPVAVSHGQSLHGPVLRNRR